MKKYRKFIRGKTWYREDIDTGEQKSLKTKDKVEAERRLHALNEAHRLPQNNRQLAKIYYSATDPEGAERTWQDVFDAIVALKKQATAESTARRWEVAIKDKAFDTLRKVKVCETRPDHFLGVLTNAKVSTNVHLRKIHNFALEWGYLSFPVIPKSKFPKVRYKEKRAITAEEHQKIIDRERNPERRAYYQLLWEIGAAQGDLADLHADAIDWNSETVCFNRRKTGQACPQKLTKAALEILRTLPKTGPLFPYLRSIRTNDRATEFRQRCQTVGISGISLHSYRFAWAERGQKIGYPERYAQLALGHGSKAVARFYARNAALTIPSLDEFEAGCTGKIVPVKFEQQKEPKSENQTSALAV